MIKRQQGGRHQFVCHLVFLLKRVKKKGVQKIILTKCYCETVTPTDRSDEGIVRQYALREPKN